MFVYGEGNGVHGFAGNHSPEVGRVEKKVINVYFHQ